MKNASTVPNRYVCKSVTLCMAMIACLIATILSGFSRTANAAIPDLERKTLLALYNSTHGENWTHKDGWNGVPGTECSNSTPWFGVGCDATSSHVIEIDLHNNNLTGSIPFFSGLAKLGYFAVNSNQLTGAIPSLSGLTNLDTFYAYSNQLTGEIPPLSGLTNLHWFVVSSNQLTGAIPSLSGLTNLTYFYVNSNQLTGAIPSLTGLTKLNSFNVYFNQLTGAIPNLTGLNVLHNFSVAANHLTGVLPVAPSGLVAGQSSLCANDFPESSYVASPAWDAATGTTPWYTPCNKIFKDGFE